MMRKLLGGWLIWMVCMAGSATAQEPSGVWIQVDSTAQTLTVLDGERVLLRFSGISIGRYGTTQQKLTRDNKTPLGRYHIAYVKRSTSYYRFFGLSYPNAVDAEHAYADGRITLDDYKAIVRAAKAGRLPPQNTKLGGYIGIHGIGDGDLQVHRSFNWTNGCIALTNGEIDQLSRFLTVGTPVEIR